jgi:hypothetical protein
VRKLSRAASLAAVTATLALAVPGGISAAQVIALMPMYATCDFDFGAPAALEAEKRGKLRGIGMSCYIEACGIAPSAAVGSLGAG